MWLLLFGIVILLFGFVLLFGAPYLPTRRRQAQTALDLLDLQPGQTLFELGCGDGRVLRQAAERGLRAVGYELNPILVLVARAYTWRYRKVVKVVWGNFWRADLSAADGVFVFLLDRYMEQFDNKLQQRSISGKKTSLPVVSYAFKIPGKKPKKARDGLFLYTYK